MKKAASNRQIIICVWFTVRTNGLPTKIQVANFIGIPALGVTAAKDLSVSATWAKTLMTNPYTGTLPHKMAPECVGIFILTLDQILQIWAQLFKASLA